MSDNSKTEIVKKVSDEELDELIHKYCRDFTALERAGRFDPIFGREEEVDDMILILLQKGRKNVCLLAPAGVGKTAMCVALSQRIVAGDVPDMLQSARLLEIDLASMAAGTAGPAEFQGRFIPLCRGIAERYHDPDYPPIILFMDEIHTIMPMVEGSAYRGLSEVMKPYLTVGDLCVIGATTVDEHRMFVATDPAMDRRFQKVHLSIPTDEETIKILEALRPGYEKHHGISVPDECLEEIVTLTSEHMRTRNQPDKSIITLDGACAHHVKEYGRHGELGLQSVYAMMGRETGIHIAAFGEELPEEPISPPKPGHENEKEEKKGKGTPHVDLPLDLPGDQSGPSSKTDAGSQDQSPEQTSEQADEKISHEEKQTKDKVPDNERHRNEEERKKDISDPTNYEEEFE